MDAKNKITYFSAYTFCLIFPLLILGGCFRHEISLWQDWPIYVPFLVIGIFASFGNTRTRNLAFLFQMPVFLQLLFTTLFFRLLVLEESYHVVISTFVYCALFATWHAFSRPTVSAWQMLCTICLSLIFTHAVLYAYCAICYDTSWSEYIHSSGWQISSDISLFIGLFFTALFCQAKPYTPKWILWFGCLCLCPFIGGFYLSPTISHSRGKSKNLPRLSFVLPQETKEKCHKNTKFFSFHAILTSMRCKHSKDLRFWFQIRLFNFPSWAFMILHKQSRLFYDNIAPCI